ncbi:hypothetical protein Ancab_006794 [Ancistrocladus abbreviatus]
MCVRLNFYARRASPDLVLGLKLYADGSAITKVFPDKEVGLQFPKDEQRFETISNGKFKCPVHRAVVASERERMPVAIFCSPDPEQEIAPAEELVNSDRPRYKNVKLQCQLFRALPARQETD